MSQAPRINALSQEAEQGVLGALLNDGEAFDRIAVSLRPEHFYREDHRLIFRTIAEAVASGKPADVLSVDNALKMQGKERAAGGFAYLVDLANSMPSSALIKRHAEIVVEHAQLRGLLAASGEIAQMAQEASITTAEKVARAQALIQAIGDNAALGKPTPQRLADAAARHMTRMQERTTGEEDAIPTGFTDLDLLLNGGFRRGQLVFIAGRPAMGKTSLALQMALAVAKHGQPALVCSQEMPERDLMDRVYALQSGVTLETIIKGNLVGQERDRINSASALFAQIPLFIDEQSSLTFLDVATKARYVRRQCNGLGLVVVDYLQLMAGQGDSRNDSRNTEIEQISRSLKALAKELRVPVVALSQLNRGLEQRPNKRPLLADLRDSGSIEQDGDIVMFIYRDEVYNEKSLDLGTAEILVRKHRQGRPGQVRLAWRGECTAFGDLDHSAWQEYRRVEKEKREADKPMRRNRQKGFSDA